MPGLNASGQPALAFSPQRSQFVALGSDDQRRPGLLVIDFTTGRRHAVPIDRRATRMRDTNDVTRAWVEHLCEWQRDVDGTSRLVPRRQASPWPWQGHVSEFGGHFVECKIGPLDSTGLDALREWLGQAFQGSWVPDPTPSSTPQPTVWQAPGGTTRIKVSAHEAYVSVYETLPLGASRTPEGEAWIRRIGERFNAELRTGTWDRHFEPLR